MRTAARRTPNFCENSLLGLHSVCKLGAQTGALDVVSPAPQELGVSQNQGPEYSPINGNGHIVCQKPTSTDQPHTQPELCREPLRLHGCRHHLPPRHHGHHRPPICIQVGTGRSPRTKGHCHRVLGEHSYPKMEGPEGHCSQNQGSSRPSFGALES